LFNGKKILPISLKLNFSPNTSGCYGLRLTQRYQDIKDEFYTSLVLKLSLSLTGRDCGLDALASVSLCSAWQCKLEQKIQEMTPNDGSQSMTAHL